MIGKTELALGLGKIAVAVRQPLDQETADVYHDALAWQIADLREWADFIGWCLRGGKFEWFPKLRELVDALREFRGDPPLLAEATTAYERVLAAGNYSPEGGTTWDYRSIRERCGEAAAEAFLVAGGNAAFSSTWRESDRRERFLGAYSDAVRESPSTKLLPPGPTLALLPPFEGPTREEAQHVIRRLQDIADVEPARPKAKPLTAEEWDARKRALEQQGRELASTPEGA